MTDGLWRRIGIRLALWYSGLFVASSLIIVASCTFVMIKQPAAVNA